MRRYPNPLAKPFLILLGLTFLVWLLRGLGIFTFLPGVILWALILLTFTTGIAAGLQQTR